MKINSFKIKSGSGQSCNIKRPPPDRSGCSQSSRQRWNKMKLTLIFLLASSLLALSVQQEPYIF